MKPKKLNRLILPAVATFAMASGAANAATINLDLTTSNTGGIVLDAGANDFSFASFDVDYLIVAGGGSGGGVNSANRAGGGGGAGGLHSGATSITGAQSITVGAGGVVGVVNGSAANIGTSGGNSVAFGLTATGGGAGGTNSTIAGVAGGSGGGGGNNNGSGGAGGARTASPVQGNDGIGGTTSGPRRGGGGGGAGAAGSGATGGAGFSSSITGTAVTYAAGGNGGVVASGSGVGIGATGAANTGNGGGGGFRNTSAGAAGTSNTSIGGNGGSGIVVASYAGTTQLLSGGIASTVGGNTIHTFNAGGTLDLHSATINGDISGAGGNLLWDKTGTLALGGDNTYTGTTTISLGMVSLSGLIASTSDLTFGVGTLFLDSTGVINVLQSNYSLLDASADIANSLITGADTLQVSTFNDGSNDFTRISVIPEPRAALLGGLGLLALLRRRR